jgi:DNA-binding SARP family transcriptional activator
VNAQTASLAKITRPSLAGVIPRDRLFQLLDNARRGSIVWLTGPPGSGKTTLAAAYLENRKLASVWYQLDEGDADVASFFYYLGLAIAEQAKHKSAPLPRFSPEYHTGLSVFTRRYFQALYQGLGTSFAIVFDGYNEVSQQSVFHEVMRYALNELPAGGSVLLISRRDPPSTMARLRANRAMEAIGWPQLRLTQEESNAIVIQRRHQVPPETLVEIFNKTQGWAAGLILMLEQAMTTSSVQAPPDLSTPQLVFDYLADEVFQKSDASTQELLLTTAYLPQMTAEMARVLSKQDDAGERLENMYRNNYFITLKQAYPKPIYICHPLLREFLLSRTNTTLSKERRHQLQRASAELLEAGGLTAEAASLLRASAASAELLETGSLTGEATPLPLASADWEHFSKFIDRHARSMLDSGRSETLAQWVEALPEEIQEQNPWSLYWLAVARIYTSPRESRLLHGRAYQLFSRLKEPDPRGLLLTCSGVMDAILYEVDDFSLLDRWIDIVARLLRERPGLVSGSVEGRIMGSLLTSMILRQPHHPEIEYWANRAYEASQAQTDVNVRLFVELRVALGSAWGGHFPKAWAMIEGIRELVEGQEVSPIELALLKLVEATYFMLTAQLDPCLKSVKQGLEIERLAGIGVLSHQLHAYAAGGALAAGDLDTAESHLDQFKALQRVPGRFDLCLYHLFSSWLAMCKEDSVGAFQQQKLALRMAIEVGCPVFEVLCRIVSAHVHHDGGEARAALSQFRHVYGIARRIDNPLLAFTGLMSYAYVALESGRRPRLGMRALKLALEVAKPRNFTSFLLWRPAPLARLCSFALEAGIEPGFVAKLIRERGLALDASHSALLDWPWPLRVQTLGQFRVLSHGVPIKFAGKAQRRPLELLKVVIARGGSNVNEEHVTEALWPRIDGDSAHRSFTTTLHRLRKLLNEERAIVLSERKLTLDGRYIWTDYWAFEQAAGRIEQLLRRPREEIEVDTLTELCERLRGLYAGPFLGSEPEEGWILGMRDRMRTRFVRCIVEASRYWEQAGRPEQAIHLLEHGLEADNLAESIYRHLMMCYALSQRQAEAIDVYNRCRKTFATALGVQLSPETTAIYERLLQASR